MTKIFDEKINDKLWQVIERLDAPFFFYDLDSLDQRTASMTSMCGPNYRLWYACKANPMSAVLKVLRNRGVGIDIASRGELLQSLNVGIASNNLIATGPGKKKEYLRHLLKSGVGTIVLESLNQVYWLNDLALELKLKPQALLRVQIDWQEGADILGGQTVTPFGLGPSDWTKLDKDKSSAIDIKGFHIFQWGNLLDLDRLEKIWRRSISEINALAKDLAIEPQVYDLGGGLGIPYEKDQRPLDFKAVYQVLERLRKEFAIKNIWLELGRYFVGEAGYYFCKVIDRKTVRGQTMIVIEGGINHLARVALTKQSNPCRLFRDSSAEKEQMVVCGPLCTALDRLGTYDLPSDLACGDWLVFSKCGAYGFTESMPYFLCHSLPGEVTYYHGDMMIPRAPKNSFDWLI